MYDDKKDEIVHVTDKYIINQSIHYFCIILFTVSSIKYYSSNSHKVCFLFMLIRF